jgi:hypothetical protein
MCCKDSCSILAAKLHRIVPQTSRLISLAIALIATGLYVCSLFTEAWSFSSCIADNNLIGLDCLLAPVRQPTLILNPVWWSNFYFVVGIAALYCDRRKIASACGIIGLFFGLACLVYAGSSALQIVLVIPLGGEYAPRIGYFLWLLAMGVLACSVVPEWWRRD